MVKAAAISYYCVQFETILINPFLPVALRNGPREALLRPWIFFFSHSAHGDMATVHAESLPTSPHCRNALSPVTTPAPVTASLLRQSTENRQETAVRAVASAHLWRAVRLPVSAALLRQCTGKGLSMITAERSVVSAHLWSAVSLPGRAALTDLNRIGKCLSVPAAHCCCQGSDCGYGLFLL